jgi:hypothetical protein
MKRFTATVIAAAMAATPIAASAKCFPQDLVSALEALSLKRELMVASLSCSGDLSNDYNRFVAQYGSALDGHSRRIQAHFRQAYGGQSVSRFMKFDSALSNEISYQVMMNSEYCNEAVKLFSTVREMQQAQLIEVASSRPPLDNVSTQLCAATSTAQAPDAAPAVQTKQKPR